MNKLDELSAQSGKKRALVRLVKVAIAGCGTACMIAIVLNISHSGGITLALDHTQAGTEPRYLDAVIDKTPTPRLAEDTGLAALDEAVLAWQQSQIDSDDPGTNPGKPILPDDGEPDTPERRGALIVPDGWRGWASYVDSSSRDVSIYGVPLTEKSGAVRDAVTGKTGGRLSQRTSVDNDYFSDALFIGNSLVVGLEKSAVLDTDFYASVGLSVYGFFDKNFLPAPDGTGEYVSALEAFIRHGGYPKVYLMFGINELGWPSANSFAKQYGKVIDALLTVRPDAVIYIQGILPINETVYRASPDAQSYISNERIHEFNEALAALAENKQVFYVTPGEVLCDETGNLVSSATSDGIHLGGVYLSKWANYLKSHTADPAQ